MHSIQSVLFDIDGTLTDSASGILKCYKCALNKVRVKIPSDESLKDFIDLPLRTNLASCMPADRIEDGVAYYMHCYDMMRVGLTENRVYDGIPELVRALYETQKSLFAVTSKLSDLTLPILNLFGLDTFFRNVYGSPSDGAGVEKGVLVVRALQTETLDPAKTIMIGDRFYDIQAAQQNAIRSVGVTWGYGGEEELRDAGADYIVTNPSSWPSCC